MTDKNLKWTTVTTKVTTTMWANAQRDGRPAAKAPENIYIYICIYIYSVPAQEMAKHHVKFG